jgi:cytoskeletal protein CcmA (bactofilin family)
MAMWAKNYGFYEATVKSVGKGEALVAWADGSADESVPFDRILTNLSAFAAAPASGSKSSASTAGGSSVDVYLDGSLVGEIESDGTIRASGSIVGKFETDGSLRIDGSIVGKVEKNGNIRKGGSIVGKVEADGTVYRGGSIIGEIASDGTIYSEGSILGEAEGGNAAKIAALIFFFPLFED